jgi:hypothetical protein
LVKPEIRIVLVSTHDSVGEHHFVAIHQPADVVSVHVGNVDLVNLLRLVSRWILGRRGAESSVLAAARRVEEAFGPRRPPRWHGT